MIRYQYVPQMYSASVSNELNDLSFKYRYCEQTGQCFSFETSLEESHRHLPAKKRKTSADSGFDDTDDDADGNGT